MDKMLWVDEIAASVGPGDMVPREVAFKLIAAVRLAEKRTEQLRPILVGPEGLLFISSGAAHRAVRKLAQDCVLDILARLRSGDVGD